MSALLREHAEQQFAEELHELKKERDLCHSGELGNVSAVCGHLSDGWQVEE